MTYQELKDKYNGKYLDYDGVCGYQCWDLAQYYFVKCLGVPSGVLGGCVNVKNMLVEPKLSQLLKYFDEVPVTQMVQGDVAIWTKNHIAIFDHYEASTDKCYYFTQNPTPCVVKAISMGEFKAFRLKGSTPTPTPSEPYTTGTYQTVANVAVRTGAGTNYPRKKVKDLTADGKKNATSKLGFMDAYYKKGTKFTALEIIKVSDSEYWAKSPSGYICIVKGDSICSKKIS